MQCEIKQKLCSPLLSQSCCSRGCSQRHVRELCRQSGRPSLLNSPVIHEATASGGASFHVRIPVFQPFGTCGWTQQITTLFRFSRPTFSGRVSVCRGSSDLQETLSTQSNTNLTWCFCEALAHEEHEHLVAQHALATTRAASKPSTLPSLERVCVHPYFLLALRWCAPFSPASLGGWDSTAAAAIIIIHLKMPS